MSVSMDLHDRSECLDQVRLLCTHVALCGAKSASDLAKEITCCHTYFKIPIIEEASKEELRPMYRDLEGTEERDRWLDAYAEALGSSSYPHLSPSITQRGRDDTTHEIGAALPPVVALVAAMVLASEPRTTGAWSIGKSNGQSRRCLTK
jgi:hypothetical protein